MLLVYSYSVYLNLKYKPFKNKSVMFLTMVNELGYLSLIFMFLLINFIVKDLTERSRHKYLGYPLICLTLTIVSLNLGIGIYESYNWLKELCQKKKNRETQ